MIWIFICKGGGASTGNLLPVGCTHGFTVPRSCLFMLNMRAQLKYDRENENVRDSVVALIWCQMLMPVRFKGHRFQIHPPSVPQPLCSNMLRPPARKRLLTASKFPVSPPSHRQRIRLPFFLTFTGWFMWQGKVKSLVRMLLGAHVRHKRPY